MAKGPNVPSRLEGTEFHPRKGLPVLHFQGPALETGPLLSTFIQGNHASPSQEEAWVAFSHPYLLLVSGATRHSQDLLGLQEQSWRTCICFWTTSLDRCRDCQKCRFPGQRVGIFLLLSSGSHKYFRESAHQLCFVFLIKVFIHIITNNKLC